MVVIGLTQQVNTDAELKALTGLANQHIVWHNGLSCAFMFRDNVANGEFKADDNSGFWKCEPTLKGVDLAQYKSCRYAEIDVRTEELILNGFVYSGKTFSMSIHAQINIISLDETRTDISYPIKYSTLGDLEHYNVTDSTDLHNMYLAHLTTKRGHLDTGTDLIDSIRDAVDDLAVQAIVDNR